MDLSPQKSFRSKHCGGKFQYKRRKLALSKLAECRKFDPDGATLNVYKCFFGSHFHIGHAPWRFNGAT